ncbi:hypothetical protein ABW20_dc0100596 [Dactylellina cionopaga]|nr:hypothetical protein ABW20_dc0100596 [Dactylellina cionopaga]
MSCPKCSTRIIRSLVTDLSIQSKVTTSRCSLNRLRLSQTSIRHTSSSAPRNQSAEVSGGNLANAPTPDFLGTYAAAKERTSKQASGWSGSWKPETDLSSIRSKSRTRIDTLPPTAPKPKVEERGFDFLDDFTSATESPSGTSAYEDLNSPAFKDQLDIMPAHLKRGFPTRSVPESSSVGEDDLPWEDPDTIQKKISTKHDPVANAWKEWSTPALWSHQKVRELYQPKKLPNGITIKKFAALDVATGELKWKPDISPAFSLDKYREDMKRNKTGDNQRFDKDKKDDQDVEVPAWKIHKDAVKQKLGGAEWKPMQRLSPAAVATLKQLKADNPGMSVEEYAPIFKISPDAMRRILKSKWTPKPDEEVSRMERWKRRGESLWETWAKEGLVETKESRREKKEWKERRRELEEKAEKKRKGFVLSRGLNLKNRIL